MARILIVVDMQKDFIDGSLGTPEAVRIVNPVQELVKSWDGRVLFTRDTHTEEYPDTQEGRKLPVPHCIKGSAGWQLEEELLRWQRQQGCPVFDKVTFGSTELARYLAISHLSEPIEEIMLVGLCTDICVISNALLIKAYLPEVPIKVNASCCAGVSPDSHTRALEAMRMCQIEIV